MSYTSLPKTETWQSEIYDGFPACNERDSDMHMTLFWSCDVAVALAAWSYMNWETLFATLDYHVVFWKKI